MSAGRVNAVRALSLVLAASVLLPVACHRGALDVIFTPPRDASATDEGGAPDLSSADMATDLGTDALADLGADRSRAPGCTAPTLAAGDRTVNLDVGGTRRSYLLHVPAAYDGKAEVPLVVDFHGLAVNGSYQRSISPYPAVLDPEGVIMAFPNGLQGPSGAGWDLGPCCVANADDVAFTRALVNDITNAACIDRTRIYAVGFSMGGGMAHHLGCKAADLFAAIAPSAFDLLQETVDACRPARPLTVISFRGTMDNLVPYEGGYSPVVGGMPITFLGAQATFKKWAALDQCPGNPSAPDDNGCATYKGCAGGAEVILCTKTGGGTDQGNASIAWPILKAHSL